MSCRNASCCCPGAIRLLLQVPGARAALLTWWAGRRPWPKACAQHREHPQHVSCDLWSIDLRPRAATESVRSRGRARLQKAAASAALQTHLNAVVCILSCAARCDVYECTMGVPDTRDSGARNSLETCVNTFPHTISFSPHACIEKTRRPASTPTCSRNWAVLDAGFSQTPQARPSPFRYSSHLNLP